MISKLFDVPEGQMLTYGFLRQVGRFLDMLNEDGYLGWDDASGRWRGCWQGQVLSPAGFGSLGELVLKLVSQKFGDVFVRREQVGDWQPFDWLGGQDMAYSMLWLVCDFLNSLCGQGLVVCWDLLYDDWLWRWEDEGMVSSRRFLTFGEAFVDAVVVRFPEVFLTQEAKALA